jgi:hypothetical protein
MAIVATAWHWGFLEMDADPAPEANTDRCFQSCHGRRAKSWD